jgi:hypothetical protein
MFFASSAKARSVFNNETDDWELCVERTVTPHVTLIFNCPVACFIQTQTSAKTRLSFVRRRAGSACRLCAVAPFPAAHRAASPQTSIARE